MVISATILNVFFNNVKYFLATAIFSVLIFTENGEELVDNYREMGVQAALLGKTTDGKERVILGGEEKRFIDKDKV